jgi:hypothetical protein
MLNPADVAQLRRTRFFDSEQFFRSSVILALC